jgi:hypothetical protein
MPSWKRVIVSGSDAILNSVTATAGFTGSLLGNASTATILQTARTINGTSFNGSANITTANWGTTRTITIGATGKSVNGSGNVAWSLAEIGAQAALTNPVTGTGTTNYVSKFTGGTTIGNSQIFDNGTNVGIGTTSPSQKLDVSGSIAISKNAEYIYGKTSSGGNVRLLGINAGNVAYVGAIDSGPISTIFNASTTSLSSAFYTAGTERVRIDSSGNVGIGTTSPSAKLDVVGNIGVSGNILDTTIASFKWDTSGYLYAGNFGDPQGNLAYQVDAGIASITNQDSFDTSWIDNPSYNGQVLVATAGETVVAGQLVYLRTDGSWYLAAATAVATATQLIGIALNGANANRRVAILLDGLIGISYHDQFGTITSGAPLYVSTTAGNVSEAPPSNSGEIVRLVGHNIYENSSNYAVIRFQPDNTWLEL